MCQTVSTRAPECNKGSIHVVTWEELALHNSVQDNWIAIEGQAYDVTQWAKTHPGGFRLLEMYAGRDATDAFLVHHTGPQARKLMKAYCVGKMETEDPKPLPKSTVEFRKLAKSLEPAGLYKVDRTHYYKLAVALSLLFAAAFCLVSQGYLIAGAVVLGCFWQQMAFCGHDALHHNITSHVTGCRKIDNVLGLLTGVFLGIGFSFWTDNHNAHHTVVNSADNDPECQFLPFIAPTALHISDPTSPTSKGQQLYLKICKYLVSYQHLSLLPLLFVARYKFYIQAIGHIATGGKVYFNKYVELLVECAFFSWYGALVALVPGGWQHKVFFILISHGADFFLYLQTVITHFPRDLHPGISTEDWMTEQCLGTMNWSCSPGMDWLHGGLHFQIEHHLFPRLPRHSLRKVSQLVKPLCAELGVEYHCPTFFGAIWETCVGLEKVALIARKG